MGTLGKILLFINLLAAGGVAYLATQDWSKRQEVAAAATRHALVLHGLPVVTPAGKARTEDSVPVMIPVSGGVPVESIRPALLDAHFKDAPGGAYLGNRGRPPATQVDEVKEVQSKVQGLLGGQQTNQLELLCGKFGPAAAPNQARPYTPGWLTGLAESFEERDLVRQLADTPNTDPQQVPGAVKQATDMLDKKFKAVLAEPNPALAGQEAEAIKTTTENLKSTADRAQKAYAAYVALINQKPPPPETDPALAAARKEAEDALKAQAQAYEAYQQTLRDTGTAACRDDDDRRRRIAHLLMQLDHNADWQRRVALVVGLRTYKDALHDQVNRLRAMAISANLQLYLDQDAFSAEFELMKSLAIDRTVLLVRQRLVTADLRNQLAADRTAVLQRKAQYDQHRADLARMQQEVADALARQQAVESALFAVQRQVGDALTQNAELERRLETAEHKRAATTIPRKAD
jgi:hypothetical protein